MLSLTTILTLICGAVALLELALWLPPLWRFRKTTAEFVALLTAFSSIVLLATDFSAWQWLLLVLSGYRVFNLVRVYRVKVHPDYLFHSARRTSWWLISSQLAVVAGAAAIHQLGFINYQLGVGLSVLSLLGSLILLASTVRHLRTTRPPRLDGQFNRHDLPSLTVAIPARNETTDLEECLRSLIASNYPKLEILVLDDCSQNGRTPEIIRGFAHDGVRFVAGEVPPERWLAKNFAYQQLAATANGDYLLFCGVDARFEPQSLQNIMGTMLTKQKTMLSVIPRNVPAIEQPFLSMLVQAGRYAWELALPRRWLERPPVLSTCWVIKASTLKAAGGLEAVSRTILPERYLAKFATTHDDGYSFVAADQQWGVSSHKPFAEQQATAVRTRYPSLHRCPERVAAVSLTQLLILLLPLYCIVVGAAQGHWLLFGVAAAAFVASGTVFCLLADLTYRRFVPSSILAVPLAVIYDLGVLHYSMWRYEFSEVLWKGRNVCVPVMHVISRLPPID